MGIEPVRPTWWRRVLLTDLGGSRWFLYGLALVLGAALLVLPRFVPTNDEALRLSGEAHAVVVAQRFRLFELKHSTEVEMAAAVAKAFKDGKALAAHIKPQIVLTGTTPVMTVAGPVEIGNVEMVSHVSVAVVTIPAVGRPFAKGEVTTDLTVPKFNLSVSQTAPINFEVALVADDRVCPEAVATSVGGTTTGVTTKRTLVGLDLGVVLGAAEVGYEVGARVYPKALAFNLKLAEAHAGLYGRVESSTGGLRAAAGVSLIFGVGRGK